MVAREPPKKLTIREESRDGPEEQQKTVSCNQRTYSILLKILVYLNKYVLHSPMFCFGVQIYTTVRSCRVVPFTLYPVRIVCSSVYLSEKCPWTHV